MIRRAPLAAALAAGLLAPGASAATLKLVNLTADWCPNCQILEPRLEEAVARYPEGTLQVIHIDLTRSRGQGPEAKAETFAAAAALAEAHNVGHVWNAWAGMTGLVPIVTGDTGEITRCLASVYTAEDIRIVIDESLQRVATRPKGKRMPEGADCPPPLG